MLIQTGAFDQSWLVFRRRHRTRGGPLFTLSRQPANRFIIAPKNRVAAGGLPSHRHDRSEASNIDDRHRPHRAGRRRPNA